MFLSEGRGFVRIRTGAALVLLLCLLVNAALAGAPDMRTLTYTAPAAYEVQAEEAGVDANRVIPVDVWLDATPNMGGINVIADSLLPSARGSAHYEGGFHYRYVEGRTELHGWYVDLLEALPELMGPQRSRLRVLRYDDGLFSEELLEQYGLTDTPSVQRDLHTWATDASAETFTAMVEPDARQFYTPGSAAANRAKSVTLENAAQREDVYAAQAAGLALHREGRELVQREAGEAHLMMALSSLDPDHLSLITVDTWSLGRMTQVQDGTVVDSIAPLLEASGLFQQQDLSMTVFALRMDYVGAISSFAWEQPAEALQWGRLTNGSGKWRECAMPRCMLLLVAGHAAEVAEMSRRLETLFSSEAFAGQRGFQDGDGQAALVNYFYEDQRYTRTAFDFAYVREDIPRAKRLTCQTLSAVTEVTQNGTVKAIGETLVAASQGGRYADQEITLQFPLPETGGVKLDAAALEQAVRAELIGSLTLTETYQNTPANRAALDAAGTQYVAYRDQMYAFAPLENMTGAAVTAAVDGQTVRVTLHLAGASLTPGWRTFRLTMNIPAEAWQMPNGFAWLQDNDLSGAADAGKWNYAYSEKLPAAWLTLPQKIHDASGTTRRELANTLRHAWCIGTESQTLGMTPNIPPVFRLLGAEELVRQLRQSALSVSSPLAVLDVTVLCTMEEANGRQAE